MSIMTPALPDLLESWLPGQRWFPSRGREVKLRRVGGIKLQDPAGEVGLEVHIIAVVSGRRTDVISVPLSIRSKPATESGMVFIGESEHSERGRRWVYDGTSDPVFVAAWLELMRTSGTTADDRTEGQAHGGFESWNGFPLAVSCRALAGEQSNTSVVVETDRVPLIVKFYRILAEGNSPDVEVSAALTSAGSTDVPVTYGAVRGSWRTGSGESEEWTGGHLSVVREFVQDGTDAWRSASAAALDGVDFTAEAEELGRVTGRIHAQLRRELGSRAATADETQEFLETVVHRIQWAWREGHDVVGPLDAEVDRLLSQLRALEELPELQRIHADYHLGQVLYSPTRGWIVLDFEGEPLRSAAERSVPDVPLRDVVGMLRSFDYAAGVVINAAPPANRIGRTEEARRWAKATSHAFLRGYEEESGNRIDPTEVLFTGLWVDKALYEVVYELRSRPDWVEVPATAVRRALDSIPGEVLRVEAPERSSVPQFVPAEILQAVSEGRYHQPHQVLGAHLAPEEDRSAQELVTVRTLRRLAQSVEVVSSSGTFALTHEHNGIWAGTVPVERAGHVPDYRLSVMYDGGTAETVDDPYRFLPTLGEMDLHLIGEGRHESLWTVLGSHVRHYSSVLGDVNGVSFAVWAPNARAIRVKADFNGWDGSVHAMRSLGGSGVWELFIPDVETGARYKYEILGSDGQWRDKADPMARFTEVPPLTASRVVESTYSFEDDQWMAERAERNPHNGPMSVYEVHLGSWRVGLSYRELADQLVEYVQWQGFTHVELMPVAEHPFGGSWGYQVTSYYAPTSRFGDPDDFKFLVDRLHQAGIGVLLDWVPAHFPKDSWALAKFDGQPLYEHPDPFLGEHQDWGTLIFDFGRNQVRNFLVANALYWLEEFHIDGLRVDAVASMLYLDYSREAGQWRPNVRGGRENLEAIAFLQEVNATAYRRAPGVVMIAEESTAFDGVTRPTSAGGLGFGIKWNMGWMHDSLQYVAEDPINRGFHHNKATFSLAYAYTENFLLPISHDEVVHGKGSLLRKMPGDRWQQLANLRAYFAFQWAHPGKQLIFMGTEFGQESEWSEAYGLDWWLSENPPHKGVQELVRSLNAVYRQTPALYAQDNEPSGFQWIDENDRAHNVLSFIRWDLDGKPLVCVANFSGSTHEGYRLGLPNAGQWRETLNTDASEFGGAGGGNMGVVQASDGGVSGQPAGVSLTLPALSVLYLIPA
ncbi:1,4-alpha-glucan branching protein GlgB [Arthrobacter roseus]|uniref:1,4-alpha-glucan branching protein GlgB n=1 Tax=Arthrobacter roseus TaxID=136274 RepID=UPI0019629080|nr:1,4-alpha-glucan branching protein GlgB [Arthrobacter roseus]MBM7847710.1 1,4-alpha-glucan branching enzyme [Arthrobacter roseus]